MYSTCVQGKGLKRNLDRASVEILFDSKKKKEKSPGLSAPQKVSTYYSLLLLFILYFMFFLCMYVDSRPNESKKPIILAAVELLLKSSRARNWLKFSALFSCKEANRDLGNMNLGQDLTRVSTGAFGPQSRPWAPLNWWNFPFSGCSA